MLTQMTNDDWADVPTEAHEQAEHAQHAAHSGDRTLILASATIALMAVAAATVGSLETIEGSVLAGGEMTP